MFNFFKKKDFKGLGAILAKQAKIETVYEQGRISGLFILLQDDKKIINKIQHSETISTFIGAIEERIKNKDYEDAVSRYIDDCFGKNSSREDNVSKVRRIVSGNNYDPIFHWQPPA